MEEPTVISPEELQKVAGGKTKIAMATVWSKDGERVNLYYSPYEGSVPFSTVSNGSQFVMEKKVYKAPSGSGVKFDAFYKAEYFNVCALIKEKEVTIDWM